MSEATENQEVVSTESQTSTTTSTTTKKRSKKTVTIKNLRNGKLSVCGQILQSDEEYTLKPKDLKNEYQMKIVQRLKTMGMIKEI